MGELGQQTVEVRQRRNFQEIFKDHGLEISSDTAKRNFTTEEQLRMQDTMDDVNGDLVRRFHDGGFDMDLPENQAMEDLLKKVTDRFEVSTEEALMLVLAEDLGESMAKEVGGLSKDSARDIALMHVVDEIHWKRRPNHSKEIKIEDVRGFLRDNQETKMVGEFLKELDPEGILINHKFKTLDAEIKAQASKN